MNTLIAIDIGNTSAHLARYEKGKWRGHRRVATGDILQLSHPKNKNVDVVIASVVPKAGKKLRSAIAKNWGVPARLIGPAFSVPIVNRYKDPRQVGLDRLLGALAAFKRFKRPLIVVDFGTAITFDVVSKKGEYLGGVIAPGIEISLEALFQKTALLPKIRLQHPVSTLGKDTVESIRVGCSVGIGGLCDRVIERVEKDRGFHAKVVATGGYASFMKRYCRRIDVVDPNLVLEGIRLTYSYRT